MRSFLPWLSLATLAISMAGADIELTQFEVELDDMIEKSVPLRTHSLVMPYVDSDLQNRWWDFGADVIINTNKHVRLTQDKPSQTGWLWSRMPLTVQNFQIEWEFKVDGKAHNLFGDGYAFWIAKDRAKPGPVFGSIDFFNGLGLFFDTYANSRHAYQWPRISAMMGDGKTQYDHDHDNEAHEFAGCSEFFRRKDHATKARLSYIKDQQRILVEVSAQTAGEWTKCFETKGILPESAHVGFSALTGDVSDSHDIVSVNTYSLILRPEYRTDQPTPADRGRQGRTAGQSQVQAAYSAAGAASSVAKTVKRKAANAGTNGGAIGWFLFTLKIIGLGAFVAFCIAAYRTYNAQQKSRRNW